MLGWAGTWAQHWWDRHSKPAIPRKDASLLYFRRSISEPVTPENTNKPYGESPVSTAMGAYFNKKAYTSPELRKKYTKDGFWVNIRIIRYPDVLLMAAEAANEKAFRAKPSTIWNRSAPMHAVQTAAYCPKSRLPTRAHCVKPFAMNAA